MSRLRARVTAADGGRERGVTLVETIVYCALLAIVLPLAGTMLVDTLRSQRDVQAVTAAGTAGQTVTRSLELGLRNASAVSAITYRQLGTTGQYDEFFVARTQQAGTTAVTWQCEAWFYDAALDVLYSRSAPATGPAPVIAMPSSGATTSWTALAEGVTPSTAGYPIFSAWNGGVSVDLATSAGARKPVVLSSAITKRTQWQTGSAPCF